MAIITYAKGKNTKLTENFLYKEFDCRCSRCTTTIFDTALADGLQKIRNHFGKPLIPTSGFRCQAHNSEVSGASKSYHMLGMACDFTIPGVNTSEIAKYAESIGFFGIGCYPSDGFVHVDTRPKEEKFFWYNHTETPTDTFGGEPGMYDKETDNDVVNEIVELLKKHGYV